MTPSSAKNPLFRSCLAHNAETEGGGVEGGRVGTLTGRVFANPDFLGWVEGQDRVTRQSACGFRTPEKQDHKIPSKQRKTRQGTHRQRKGGRGHLLGESLKCIA